MESNIFLKQNMAPATSVPSPNGELGGPSYDKQGNIISRSLVGKPEWFMKNSGGKLTKEDLKMLSSKKSKFQTNQSISV